jgi:2-amino-4-hydroxy-6-hydroxymethyldihydropteridine diphosphokinase
MPSPGDKLADQGPFTKIGLGLGSNIGDKPANIRRALALLEERGIVRLCTVSSIYRTPPWGYEAQEFFANACALGETSLRPLELLAAVNSIEKDMGRKPSIRWGPRLIDIDILFFGTEPFSDPKLSLPHKSLFDRDFVLIPLAEIAPNLEISGRSIAEAVKSISGVPIQKWEDGV